MLKKLFKTFFKLYNIKIITIFIVIFVLSHVPLLQKIPDFFKLNLIESKESYYLTLLSIIIGFSSVILTIILVVYGAFSKKIKRNSIDFILDNDWIKLAFSIFISSLLFVSLSLLTLRFSTPNSTTTLIYISSFIAFFSILIQFPLVVLSLKHSNSYEQIERLINGISDKDICNLVSPSKIENETKIITVLEKNKIIQIKDIGVFAIKENDWSLPQSILNDLYDKLIKPLSKDTNKKTFNESVYAFSFICNHFKNIIIEETDYVTIKVLLNVLYRTHIHFAKSKIRIIRNNPIDENLKDLCRLIIENNNFYNIQPYLLRNANLLIKEHVNSIEYSDSELPTMDYNLDKLNDKEKDYKEKKEDEVVRNYWFYVTHELPDIFFEILEHAIEKNNKNVYAYFEWKLHSLMGDIYNSNPLTEHQKNSIFREYSFKASRITDLAIKNNIYEHIYPISEIQIEQWIVDNRKQGIRSLYDFAFFVERLNVLDKLTRTYIDDLFMIGRRLSTRKMDVERKIEAFKIILEYGFGMYENDEISPSVKTELIRQLKWLNGYLKDNEELKELNNEYSDKIDAIA